MFCMTTAKIYQVFHMKIKDTSHMCKLWGAGGRADTAAASHQMRML